jgi:hypothetical protein
MGKGTGMCWVFVGKPEGKKPQDRPRHRWEDNIKMDLKEVGCGCMDWIELRQMAGTLNVVINLQVP